MKYKVINIINGETVISSDSKAEIKAWFSRLNRLWDLNVTGKDTGTMYPGLPFIKFYFRETNPARIRKYQVLDDEGRSVDPRDWEVEDTDEPTHDPCIQISFIRRSVNLSLIWIWISSRSAPASEFGRTGTISPNCIVARN